MESPASRFINAIEKRKLGCVPLYDAFDNAPQQRDAAPAVVLDDQRRPVGAVALAPGESPVAVRVIVLAPFAQRRESETHSILFQLLEREARTTGVELNHIWRSYRPLPAVVPSAQTAAGRLISGFEARHVNRVFIAACEQSDGAVFPIVVEENHAAIGIVALFVKGQTVDLHLLSTFEQRRGNGSKILGQLCSDADHLDVTLRLSPTAQFGRTPCEVPETNLREFYARFGFEGGGEMLRAPRRGGGKQV